MARGASLVALAAVLSGCCDDSPLDVAIERAASSQQSCIAICRGWAEYSTSDDVEYELHGCDDDVSEDGRELVLCHVTEIDCRQNNHF